MRNANVGLAVKTAADLGVFINYNFMNFYLLLVRTARRIFVGLETQSLA